MEMFRDQGYSLLMVMSSGSRVSRFQSRQQSTSGPGRTRLRAEPLSLTQLRISSSDRIAHQLCYSHMRDILTCESC